MGEVTRRVKPQLTSKTNWLGVIMILASLLGDPTLSTVAPPEWMPWILRVSGLLTIGLRQVTSEPVR